MAGCTVESWQRPQPKQAKRHAGCGLIKLKMQRSTELNDSSTINDKVCTQLVRHRAALGRAMRAVNESITDIESGKNPIRAIQDAIEVTERLWCHTSHARPQIDNGVLSRFVFDLLDTER